MMETLLNAAALLVSSGATFAVVFFGLHMIHPKWRKKKKKNRLNKPDRARAERQAIYDAATEAHQALLESKHKQRVETVAIWVRQWSEAGASTHELNSSFQKWEGEPFYAWTEVVVRKADGLGYSTQKVRWQAMGTIDDPFNKSGHRWAVGSESTYFSHLDPFCPKCIRIREALNEKKALTTQEWAGQEIQTFNYDGVLGFASGATIPLSTATMRY